jgi:hypothetical protein
MSFALAFAISDLAWKASSGDPLSGPSTGRIISVSIGTIRPSGNAVTADSWVWLMPATT